MIPDRNSRWMSLDSSLSIDMCQQWRKIFVYPTSDPDRNTFGDMSDLEVAVKMFSRSEKAKKRFLVTFQYFQDYDEYR